MKVDVVIIGGGASGLWLLDELSRLGYAVLLLEAFELGKGQTVASQGIIHGGLKYMLGGLPTRSAREIRNMPSLWRDCLRGVGSPDLRNTRVRAQYCHLWRTGAAQSRFGMWAASLFLRTPPKTLRTEDRPAPLANCPGVVARIEEPVIAPMALMADLLQQHRPRILRFDLDRGMAFSLDGPGQVRTIELIDPDSSSDTKLTLQAGAIVLTAGVGNARLRTMAGLTTAAMQRRPLHMVMLRGDLPELNGHCIDGAKTRATITSDVDSSGRRVWQVGGQLAEAGVAFDEGTLLDRAKSELQVVLPEVDLRHVEWSTYRVDRAEVSTKYGMRPSTAQLLHEGNVLTAWPTKLALVPQLVRKIRARLSPPQSVAPIDFSSLVDWPRPQVAVPPWEQPQEWRQLNS